MLVDYVIVYSVCDQVVWIYGCLTHASQIFSFFRLDHYIGIDMFGASI